MIRFFLVAAILTACIAVSARFPDLIRTERTPAHAEVLRGESSADGHLATSTTGGTITISDTHR